MVNNGVLLIEILHLVFITCASHAGTVEARVILLLYSALLLKALLIALY